MIEPFYSIPDDAEIERERQRRRQQDAEPAICNPPPATVDALLAECEKHRSRIVAAMKQGQQFHACTDASFATILKGRKTGFLLPPFSRLFDAAVALDLGDAPALPSEPQTGRDAVAALDMLIQWCKAILQPASTGAAIAGLEGQSPAVQLAWSQYQGAIHARPDLGERGTDREVYDFVKHTCAKDGDGVQLPALETWQRYLRSARRALNCRKHEPRHGRPHGSSIVHQNQIETGSEPDF